MRDGHLEGRGRIAGQRVCRAAAPDAVFPAMEAARRRRLMRLCRAFALPPRSMP